MDATRQTAAGDGLEELFPDPLDFGDLGLLGLLERLELLDPFLFGFLAYFFLFLLLLLFILTITTCRTGRSSLSWLTNRTLMKDFAISSSITSTLLPKLANFLTFPLWLGRSGTFSGATSGIAGFTTSVTRLGDFMFVSAVVFTTAPFVPCYAIPLWDESSLALDCRSGGPAGT